MPKPYTVTLGKAVRTIARLRGGGSALPGLFVEKIDPTFVKDTLAQLPEGVVVVSGTNGKTTTTKMVVELLESQGLRVFTNRTGSNFVRGVAAALLGEVDSKGKLDKDIAVLELDEAHAVQFVKTVQPRYCLLLNVMRDQLDRFGEIDTIAKLLATVAGATSHGIVLNRDDPRLAKLLSLPTDKTMATFGVAPALMSLFPSDDELRATARSEKARAATHDDTSLITLEDQTAVVNYGGVTHTVTLKVNGIYNTLNAVAAVAITRLIRADALDEPAMLNALENVTPAFGRGESFTVDGRPLELVLVKNPGGFRLGLQSFDPAGYATMIAVNDNYADGRDMSWLWDVDFDSLEAEGVSVLSGVRAYDMALRLQYEQVEFKHVEPNLKQALKYLIDHNHDKPKRIYCTYTAMLTLRRALTAYTDVEGIS